MNELVGSGPGKEGAETIVSAENISVCLIAKLHVLLCLEESVRSGICFFMS